MPDTLMSGSLPRILVVDDDPVMLRTLAGMLAGRHEVALARSAEQALPLIAAHPPELLLLDLQLPGLGGIALCRALKADPVLQDIPVVFLTAHADEATEVEGLQAGAADFIAKPPSAPVMLARLGNLVRLRRLSARLQAEARSDGLTGLRNRAQFDRLLRGEWQRAQREARPLSLLLADIDHFKAYNDACGHPAGDQVLREVAQVLSQAGRRPADQACRYGGEEFALLLPLTDAAGAAHVGTALLQALRARGLPHPASSVGPVVTASIGLATWLPLAGGDPALGVPLVPPPVSGLVPGLVPASAQASAQAWVAPGLPAIDGVEHGARALLEAADRALYAAKQAGRAQVWRSGADGRAEPVGAGTDLAPEAASGPDRGADPQRARSAGAADVRP